MNDTFEPASVGRVVSKQLTKIFEKPNVSAVAV